MIAGYLDGIRENFQLVKQFYPDYTMRLYADLGSQVGSADDDSLAKSALCDLACNEPSFDICDIYNIPKLGNASVLYPLLWRSVAAPCKSLFVLFYEMFFFNSQVPASDRSASGHILLQRSRFKNLRARGD